MVERYFGRDYGRFSYEHLPRTTYAQSLAQMMRLRPQKTGKLRKDGDPKGKSRTYEHLLLPRLRDLAGYGLPESPRIQDFGAGQMDYVKRLRQLGGLSDGYPAVDIIGVEFYFRQGPAPQTPFRPRTSSPALCHDLETKGRFDIVICDSVLNSVDTRAGRSRRADVSRRLLPARRPGDLLRAQSGTASSARSSSRPRTRTRTTRYVHFLDENGLTAMFSSGVWRYQKFHTLPEIEGADPAALRGPLPHPWTATTGLGRCLCGHRAGAWRA